MIRLSEKQERDIVDMALQAMRAMTKSSTAQIATYEANAKCATALAALIRALDGRSLLQTEEETE